MNENYCNRLCDQLPSFRLCHNIMSCCAFLDGYLFYAYRHTVEGTFVFICLLALAEAILDVYSWS